MRIPCVANQYSCHGPTVSAAGLSRGVVVNAGPGYLPWAKQAILKAIMLHTTPVLARGSSLANHTLLHCAIQQALQVELPFCKILHHGRPGNSGCTKPRAPAIVVERMGGAEACEVIECSKTGARNSLIHVSSGGVEKAVLQCRLPQPWTCTPARTLASMDHNE
jgi:hypothetical protein